MLVFLEAQESVGFAVFSDGSGKLGTRSTETSALTMDSTKVQALLWALMEKCGQSVFDQNILETLLLLELILVGPGKAFVPNLLGWLKYVNVQRTYAKVEDALDSRSVETVLSAVFDMLCGGSPLDALKLLSGLQEKDVAFDRLASVISSCQSESASAELKAQVEEWRGAGVPELMSSKLWRIYTLLAGDLQLAFRDAHDWKTRLALFITSRLRGKEREQPSPSSLMRLFEDYNAQWATLNPMVAFDRSAQDLEFEIDDLQYEIVLAAAGLTRWSPLCVDRRSAALGWHLSCVVAASKICETPGLIGGPSSSDSHKDWEDLRGLTVRYAQELVLFKEWDWALYVARFLPEREEREAVIKDIISLRSAAGAGMAASGGSIS